MKLRKISIVSLVAILGMVLMTLGAGPVLAAPPAAVEEEEVQQVEFTGEVTTLGATSGTYKVEAEDEAGEPVTYTVMVPAELDPGEVAVGDLVEVEGTVDEAGIVTATKFVVTTEEEDVEDDEEGGEEEDVENCFCTDPERTHPVAQRIAELYDLDYQDIMDWFCTGEYGFGEIVLALQTAKVTEGSADEFLTLRTEGQGWGEIWREAATGEQGYGKWRKTAQEPPEEETVVDEDTATSTVQPTDKGKHNGGGRPADAGQGKKGGGRR